MPTLNYPGVYIEEISGGTRPLEVAGTSTAAFVGLAEMGPDSATRITNWTEFQRRYGNFTDEGFLAHSVFQYFNNGGRQCYTVRVTRPDAVIAAVTVSNRAPAPIPGLTFLAKNKGAWGNSLFLQVEDGTLDPGNEFKVSVRRQADPAVVPANFKDITPLEVFDNLSTDPAAPNYVVAVLAEDSSLIDAQLLSGNTSTQRGVHRGGFAPVLPLTANLGFQINLDADGFQAVALPTAVGSVTTLADVATAVQTAVRALTKKKTSTDALAFTAFTCTVETVTGQSRLVLQSGTTTAASSVRVQPAAATDATALLKLGAGSGGRSEDGAAVRRPARADVVQIGDAAIAAPVTAATAGSNGVALVTETTFASAFPRLDNVTDFSLLAVPGEATTAMMDLGMAYCANRPLQDVFYIGETADHDDTADEAAAFRSKLTTANSYGALYFPWVKALDPTGRSREPVLLPPSGYIAGLYARIDANRGVWKAPAGTEASLNGVAGLAVELSDVQHGNLNPMGVDVIRRFPGSGVVVFGARTISSDPAWKYVPVRRTAIMLRVSIYNGIQFAVFEPNDEPLWSQLRLSIGSFMTTLFRQGAFQGSTPSQGFFVKCDGETTTQADIDAGVVNVLVGFAPLKPAEFVVVKISQKAGLASG
ncbi:phage tail sheath family protein [Streptomyces sp. H27-D2]|uniref:phage tail sheath family protein n=1 Tax=Streptomyces sp. H27-D2 TaxID=3046304 RepID=UPI002DBB896F|nr:phage tail sheath subtilisin-like domain-containing protein [Streptomyces sp. H27-D2]MEC4018795.1 phage tail sheath subtilisin-like domain-containing protein [Streptomyces sp. H27-D2]